ncbi:MAG TPA: RdgB/HAM1 family non-canonical purine NTP pyrophosphatase [Candidatus Nanoarchaeia archaeon]|nr:RdgB/HAM1 family non-canonical purine NTP pyrophosphatase [Candidatus Nanoarchaeia archaeon]
MNELYFITGNENKLKEAKEIMPEIKGLNMDLLEIQDINPHKIIKHKVEEARKQVPGRFIVEDVSFYLEAINGLPGPLIKWFLKTIGVEGIVKIAKTYENYKAQAKCIIGYFDGSEIKYFEGVVNGIIVEPKGNNGFGFDVIFVPDGHEKTYAEMSEEEKNQLSHRKLALEKLKEGISN